MSEFRRMRPAALRIEDALTLQEWLPGCAVSSTRAAECQAARKYFRCVNIALVKRTQAAQLAHEHDIWEVIDAAATKPFGYMPFLSGPGLGGHCIR